MKKKRTNKKGGRDKLAQTDEKMQTDNEELNEQETEKTENAGEENAENKDNGSAENAAPEQSEEDKLKAQLADANDKYLRLMAEYDNFRKRSAKERLELTASATGNAVSEILPVFDNFERALKVETADESYKKGVEMIFKQFSDAVKKLGVEIIDPTGEPFDPNIANAVSQIEDPELGENIVAQVFQKGYKIGDKVIRYAMVSVANP